MTRPPIVTVYSNFGSVGDDHPLVPADPEGLDFRLYCPKLLRRSPYVKRKHMSPVDMVKLVLSIVHCCLSNLRSSVFVADSMQTGVILSAVLFVLRGKKIVIWGYNVPRRRTGLARALMAPLMRRADRIVVFGTYDIGYSCELYGLQPETFVFTPYSRDEPQPDASAESPFGDEPFLIAVGANARDYKTLFEAVEPLGVNLLVIAREYNTEGLTIPVNTRVLHNIPLQACDELTRRAAFMVMPLDGSEPSCGQVTIVTAYLFGVPVIASSCTGTQDYIANDETGLLVPIGDAPALRAAIERLWNDDSERARLAEGARAWANTHATSEARETQLQRTIRDALSSR
jgi:glycosyltransferase involved in cell wall biosynthesis